MHRVAPYEKDTTSDTLEKRHWYAASQFHGGNVKSYYNNPHDTTGLVLLPATRL